MKLAIIFFLNFILIFLNSVLIADEREGFGLAVEGGCVGHRCVLPLLKVGSLSWVGARVGARVERAGWTAGAAYLAGPG